MTPVIRLFIKTSLLCFILTFASGSLFMLFNALQLVHMPRDLIMLHAHVGFVGIETISAGFEQNSDAPGNRLLLVVV